MSAPRNDTQTGDTSQSVPFWIGLFIVASLWGIFGILYVADGIFPTVLTINDEANYPDSFITERAAQDLKFLTDLGPKIIGSYENEYVVVDFLSKRVLSIIDAAHPNQYIEWDSQIAREGGYFWNRSIGFMNLYDKVQNVVVKLHGSNNETTNSVVVNAHFDSVPTSPGGSDNGINVVNTLEVLRVLSQNADRPLYNIIFLFNGAEEAGLKASHAYVTQHKWANESKIIVNLDAAGAGGKLNLFQTGPNQPWLLKYYSQVPHPVGSVAAEEIFQTGAIPSDTDFRIFRDFGNMVGLDMAYVKDGYRYHLKYDGFANIPLGSYQHGGDNLLSLVRSLGNASEVSRQNESSTESAVFFDVFGFFLIYYTNDVANIVNFTTAGISLGVFVIGIICLRSDLESFSSTVRFLFVTLLLILLSWVITVAFIIGVIYALDYLNKTMSWYGRLWFVFGIYEIPIIAFSGCMLVTAKYKENISLDVRAQLQAHILRLVWTLLLVLGTVYSIRSVFIITIPILFSSVGFLFIYVFRLEKGRCWQILYVLSLLLPLAYLIYQGWSWLLSLVPITGRLGSTTNPELYVGVVCLLYGLLALSPLTVLTNLLRNAIWYYLTLLVAFVAFLGLLYTPIGFPYVADPLSPRPQRQWIMHSQRKFYNESFVLTKNDSGFLVTNFDRNSPAAVVPYVPELSEAVSIAEDCEEYTLCGLPLVDYKTIQLVNYSLWIAAGEPAFPENESLNLQVVSKQYLSSTLIKYSLQVSGPDKLFFFLTPKSNTTFVNTSLVDTLTASLTFDGRPVYMLLYQLGKGDGTPLTFDFTMETLDDHVGPTVDFAITARYVHDDRVQRTVEYSEFLSEFPAWTCMTAWVAAHHLYVL